MKGKCVCGKKATREWVLNPSTINVRIVESCDRCRPKRDKFNSYRLNPLLSEVSDEKFDNSTTKNIKRPKRKKFKTIHHNKV